MNEVQESAITDFLQILEEHRKNCEQQGKYAEAEVAKTRLDELKSHEANRRRESMKAQQLQERLGMEEAHMLEYQQFHSQWEKRCKDYDDQCESQWNGMKERHLEELKDFQQKLLERQQKPKYTPLLLTYRKTEEHLARARNYVQAHKLKEKADRLQAEETEQWNKMKQKELFQKESQFKSSKRQELNALQKRINAGREVQMQQRALELERLMRRYRNAKQEMAQSQKRERIQAEKLGASRSIPPQNVSANIMRK